MIPRAIDMIFTVSSQLKDRGWKYQMEGSFLEVYNEVVSGDLLQIRVRLSLELMRGRSMTCLDRGNSTRRNTRSSWIKTAR